MWIHRSEKIIFIKIMEENNEFPEKKEKRRLSQEKRGRRLNNNHQRETSNSIRNIQEQNKFSTKQLNISI